MLIIETTYFLWAVHLFVCLNVCALSLYAQYTPSHRDMLHALLIDN